MAFFRAVLVAASLGCSAVVAIPQAASGSQPGSFSLFAAHTEITQSALQVPQSVPYNVNAPITETTEKYLQAPSSDFAAPYTETHQKSLDVPHEATTQNHVQATTQKHVQATTQKHVQATTQKHVQVTTQKHVQATTQKHVQATTQNHVQDLPPRPTVPQPQPAPETEEHIYTPPKETTLYAAGTPVVTGPAGTAIIIHGTPVAAGLPAAVIHSTTYVLAGATLWVNGRPESLPGPTPAVPAPGRDMPPNAPEPTHAHPEPSPSNKRPGDHPEQTQPHHEPKGEVLKPTTKTPEQKPGDEPSTPTNSDIKWTGPGLAAETGLSNAAVDLSPGLSLAILCLLATLVQN